jgi:hypothetical protein
LSFTSSSFATKPGADALSGDGTIFMLGVGYGIAVEHVHVSGLLYKPLTAGSSAVHYVAGGLFTLGVDFELWEGRATKAQTRLQ